MKMSHIFEILRVLGAFEVSLQPNLQGSKDAKVLQELFSEQYSTALWRTPVHEADHIFELLRALRALEVKQVIGRARYFLCGELP